MWHIHLRIEENEANCVGSLHRLALKWLLSNMECKISLAPRSTLNHHPRPMFCFEGHPLGGGECPHFGDPKVLYWISTRRKQARRAHAKRPFVLCCLSLRVYLCPAQCERWKNDVRISINVFRQWLISTSLGQLPVNDFGKKTKAAGSLLCQRENYAWTIRFFLPRKKSFLLQQSMKIQDGLFRFFLFRSWIAENLWKVTRFGSLLTPIDIQFSSCPCGNFTTNFDPARSSESFNGRKRHTTLMLSSAGISRSTAAIIAL